MRHVLLYCQARQPAQIGEALEHWKSEIPDVGDGEVITHHKMLYASGTKRFFHAIVDEDLVQYNRVKNHITNYNDGKPIQDQILYWHGRTDEDAFKSLWQDRGTDPFIEAIAIRVLRYPIKSETGDDEHPALASVKDAVDVYGLTIDPKKIKVPHKFLGV